MKKHLFFPFLLLLATLPALAQKDFMLHIGGDFYLNKNQQYNLPDNINQNTLKERVKLRNLHLLTEWRLTDGDACHIGFYTGIVHTNYGFTTVANNYQTPSRVSAVGLPLAFRFVAGPIYVSFGGQINYNYHQESPNIQIDDSLNDYLQLNEKRERFTPMAFAVIGLCPGYANHTVPLLFPLGLKFAILPSSFLNKKFTSNNSANIRPDNASNTVVLVGITKGF